MKKVLLYSGGMDSWLIDKLWEPDVKVYINLHTKYSQTELSKLPKDVKVIDFDLSKYERKEDLILPLRNLYLPMIICNEFPEDDLEIMLGATAGDRVLDKSVEFSKLATNLLSYLYQPQHWIKKGRVVKVLVSFKDKDKKQLLKEYLDKGGDIKKAWSESFSCYNPSKDNKPCFSCKPCFRKAVAFYKNSFTSFTTYEKETLYKYLKENIVDDIKKGVYGRGKEEESDIIDFYNWLEGGVK